jgi:hypothetical protein
VISLRSLNPIIASYVDRLSSQSAAVESHRVSNSAAPIHTIANQTVSLGPLQQCELQHFEDDDFP